MLTESFIDWWFAPWRLQTTTTTCEDLLAQRDGYRLWCEQHAIAADLPSQFDAGWVIAASSDCEKLCATARLFAGVMVARTHEITSLNSLTKAERKWCVSVASTQPMPISIKPAVRTGLSLTALGLAELAWRLQLSFPGIWPRLQLLLQTELRESLNHALAETEAFSNLTMQRAQRCWQVCQLKVWHDQNAEQLSQQV